MAHDASQQGTADPVPVLQRILVDPALHAHVQVDGVITMAHAKHIVQQLEEKPEASEQVAYADHIIVNHCDQCEGDELAAAEAPSMPAIRTRISSGPPGQ